MKPTEDKGENAMKCTECGAALGAVVARHTRAGGASEVSLCSSHVQKVSPRERLVEVLAMSDKYQASLILHDGVRT